MSDIMKMVKYLEESYLLITGICKTIKNRAKEQKGGFLIMILVTLGASFIENLLTGKGTIKSSEDIIRSGQIFTATSFFNKF